MNLIINVTLTKLSTLIVIENHSHLSQDFQSFRKSW